MIRPAEHSVYTGPVAVVTGQVCATLNRILNLDSIRRERRGQDPELDQTLLAIRLAGIAFENSSPGTVPAPGEETVSLSTRQLNDTLSTTETAALLHVTRRTVSQECKQKRLPATLVGGRYRISRTDIFTYQAQIQEEKR